MIRFVVIGALVSAVSPSPLFTKKHFGPKGIVEDRPSPHLPETVYVRKAPQDPVVHAGQYGGDIPQSVNQNFELDNHQAQSAHYSFDASVKDEINDHSHTRSETRDGTKVTGTYSYSDGYYFRTVQYVADENGYRVVKEDVKKIGNGPVFNSGGRAEVQGSLIGKYSIAIDDECNHHNYVDVNGRKY